MDFTKKQLYSVGCVIAKEKSMRKLFLIGSFILLTGCSEFALLIAAGSISTTHNPYVKTYNSMDVLTLMGSDKSIKKHIYDQGKKIYDRR